MNNIIFSKLLSESLLSLYPVFIKKLKLDIDLQLSIRLIIYLLISLFFCNKNFIKKYIFKYNTLLLGLINLIHIYSSYKGFELLESGLSYTLFYTYPIFILLFSGTPLHFSIFISLIGVYILTKNEFKEDISKKGLFMILIASITEALIYFYIRKINTKNNWNHLFLTYFYGTLIIILYYVFKKNIKIDKDKDIIKNKKILLSLVINSIIGSLGYYLRFYATTRLNTFVYAILSYFGILMSFIYGILFNNEKLTLNKFIGSLLIFISSKKELLNFIKNIF